MRNAELRHPEFPPAVAACLWHIPAPESPTGSILGRAHHVASQGLTAVEGAMT